MVYFHTHKQIFIHTVHGSRNTVQGLMGAYVIGEYTKTGWDR